VFPALSQRRPLVIHAFTLDLPNLTVAHAEAFDHQSSGTCHVNIVVLSVHKSEEDFLSAGFGKLLVACVFCHGTPLSFGEQSGEQSYSQTKKLGKLRCDWWV
jgi:hypothetical protein